jgi:signal transduction histidine kinase/FixJ family two-component response regulator
MSMVTDEGAQAYAKLVAGRDELDEEDLLGAYEIGRAIAAEGGGVLEAVAIHEQAMAALCRDCADVIDARANARSQQLLAEMLGPFEMALRGYRESNEQLMKARGEAESANRAKNEFLSRTSHELRTPLNAILGFGQLLELDELPEHQAASVHDILSAGRHLLKLIDEVLDISRIEAGRLAMSMEPVMIGDVADSAMSVMRPIAAERGISLNMEVGSMRAAHVQADRQRLHQVLLNLLSNAIKYNTKNGSVTLVCVEASGGRMHFEVVDTGPGIPDDKIERLFNPFDRLGAEELQIEGTGLGLALSKNLCEAMGGRLEVKSVVGTGSRFWVDLALVDSPAGIEIETLPLAAEAVTAEAEGEDALCILYIEDNPSNLKLVQRILERWRKVVLLSAIQAALGIELAQRHRPDLVLLDLHLPDRHGSEVLDELRADPDTAHIPIVVVSADATPGEVQRLLDRGADDYVTKPLDVAQFLASVERALAGSAHAPRHARDGGQALPRRSSSVG